MVECTLDLESLSKEIFVVIHNYQAFKDAESDLIYNINFLKKAKIIVVAKEYAKLNQELKYVRDKIIHLNKKYATLSQQYNKLEEKYSRLDDEYQTQLEICESHNPIVEFKRNEK
jgi:predicted nuclease with TOPRIM domain